MNYLQLTHPHNAGKTIAIGAIEFGITDMR
jgi:hypothetical protein